MGKFSSRSIAFRPKPAGTTVARSKRQIKPFRFLDLPPELRNEIFGIFLLDLDGNPLPLFLACQQTYAEAGSIYYRHVSLNCMEFGGYFHPFLEGCATPLSARLHAQNLRMRFCLGEKTEAFGSFCPALRDMAGKGRLQSLRMEIRKFFPDDEFWGCGDSDGYDDFHVGPGMGSDQVISAPPFVARPWFQDFVSFLGDSGIPKISLYVEAEKHDRFWCVFHRAHPSGEKCEGWWKGTSNLLRINRLNLIKALMGVVPVTKVQFGT
ncbi:hypothetical protein GGR53DRAFT_455521 [Hypoxylon sp. FL1150]|nr:hypothetical protein GGR53DRAFT_455521 [Hypoxylon sp. FL1150]